jgi:hypothetical protein
MSIKSITMRQKVILFDESWLKKVQNRNASDSWADEVISTLDAGGSIYLGILRLWFSQFPLSNKQKKGLKANFESFNNEDHLGAVNELSWWKFMQRIKFSAEPIPASRTSKVHKPDFRIESPANFFVEVSTPNVSEKDKKKFVTGNSCTLDHSQTLGRIIRKVSEQKQQQIQYAAKQKQPCALVLFDYTTWSGLATQFFHFLTDFLLGEKMGFKGLSDGLSALVYIERKVIDGRILISRERSAIYYNPIAKYPLPIGIFPTLNQFAYQMIAIEPNFSDHWIRL